MGKKTTNPAAAVKKDMRSVTYVKRARMWAVTTITNGKQNIDWLAEKPS